MNEMPGATLKLPTTKFTLMKAFNSLCSCDHQFYIHCETCKIYTKCFPGERNSWVCEKCQTKLKLSEINHIVYIVLEQQLKKILEKHWGQFIAYNDVIANDESPNIKDTYSGAFVQTALKKNSNTLSLMVNTDGVSLKKSSNKSVWPLQIICNFLPPRIRYLNENIITGAFYYSNQKPDMLNFFEPLANEIENLQRNGFVFKQQVFRAAITHAVLDLPAKASFQQMMQYNGYFSCGYCLHRGESTEVGVRYTICDGNVDSRKHEDFVVAIEKIVQKKSSINENGIKGMSPAICLDFFDMVESFGIDYMHCVLLGVVKNLLEFWLCSKKHHDSYINKSLQKSLNVRIRSIKPCRFITRLPRSLEHRKLFKASELRSLLLYYLPVCLQGILKTKYLDHFRILSASIYKLLTPDISCQDIICVENNLNIFVNRYQEYYGKQNMTMNVHLLTHIVMCVKNLGPLWSQSMFAFESNNATFSRYVIGHTDILAQISQRYMLHKSIEREIPKIAQKLTFAKKIKLSFREIAALRAQNILFDISKSFSIQCVYQHNNQRFTSIQYDQARKTIDYVVQLKNNIPGKVMYYFTFECLEYIMFEQFEYGERMDHVREITPKNICSVHLADVIEKKFIYINFSNKHYTTDRPNQFETD